VFLLRIKQRNHHLDCSAAYIKVRKYLRDVLYFIGQLRLSPYETAIKVRPLGG
jgi:hypothetical protein